MYLHRVTPDPFENSKWETSAMGQQADSLFFRRDALVANFDRFGKGNRRSDFEVEIEWSDVEEMIVQFSKAKHPSAIELASAVKISKALIEAGWKPPEDSK